MQQLQKFYPLQLHFVSFYHISSTLQNIVSDYDNCPFNSTWTREDHKSRSVYCPKEVCPAVFIDSQGLSVDQHKDSLGCFNYEGSLYDDLYPVYVNHFGQYLIPDEYR